MKSIISNPGRKQKFFSVRYQCVVSMLKVYGRTIIIYRYDDSEVHILLIADSRSSWQGKLDT